MTFRVGGFLAGLGLAMGANAFAGPDWDARINARLDELTNVGSVTSAVATRDARPPRRDLTLTLAAARAHWSALSNATQTRVGALLQRPTPIGAVAPDEFSWRFRNPETSIDTTHFRIHYIDKASYSSDGNAATTSFANTVALVLEETWVAEHTTLGYASVPSDTTDAFNGGDGRFDVYLADLGAYGLYGYVAPDGPSSDGTRPYGQYSYMVIDNDFRKGQYGYDDPADPLKVTVAHEYFHAIQFGYSAQEIDAGFAFMESSATWMEDQVYPLIHDNYNYLGEPYVDADGDGQYDLSESFTDHNNNGSRDEGSAEWPEAPLDAFDEPALVQYGRFVWFHYLAQNHGAVIVRTIFENCAAVAGDNMLSAIDAALVGQGSSFAAAYQDYAVWNYTPQDHYADGANYPLPWTDRVIAGSGVANAVDSPSLASWNGYGYLTQLHLSTIYTRIDSPSGNYEFITSGNTPALTMLVKTTGSPTLAVQPVTITSGVGNWTAPGNATYAIAVVSNVSTTLDGLLWVLRPQGMSSSAAPELQSVTVSGGGTMSWSNGGMVTITGTAGQRVEFSVAASDADGTTPVFHVVDNPSYGVFDATTGTFSWDRDIVAGTYDLVLRAYDRNDVRQYAQGTVRVVIGSVSKSKSKDDGFLGLGASGLAEGLALVLLVFARRRLFGAAAR